MADPRNKRMFQEKEKIVSKIRDVDVSKKYGLCQRCSNFGIIKTQYGNEHVWCEYIRDFTPSREDATTDCTMFWPKGHPPLRDMISIAYIIDINDKSIGFVSDGRAVVINPPKDENDPPFVYEV